MEQKHGVCQYSVPGEHYLRSVSTGCVMSVHTFRHLYMVSHKEAHFSTSNEANALSRALTNGPSQRDNLLLMTLFNCEILDSYNYYCIV